MNYAKFLRTPFLYKSSHRRCFVVFLKFGKVHRGTPALECLFNKVSGLKPHEKETPTQVFFCEFCQIFNNNYFEEHLRTAASIYRTPPVAASVKTIHIAFTVLHSFLLKVECSVCNLKLKMIRDPFLSTTFCLSILIHESLIFQFSNSIKNQLNVFY